MTMVTANILTRQQAMTTIMMEKVIMKQVLTEKEQPIPQPTYALCTAKVAVVMRKVNVQFATWIM